MLLSCCFPIAFLDVLFHLIPKRSDSQISVNFIMDGHLFKRTNSFSVADSILLPCYQWIINASIFTLMCNTISLSEIIP